MTFKEYRDKYGQYHAYMDWISVKHAKIIDKIPMKYADYFGDTCECGSENIISPELTQEMCCDPGCTIKVGYKLAEMFKRFDVLGLGSISCAEVYKEFRRKDVRLKELGQPGLFMYDSYVEVLRIDWKDYPYVLKTKDLGSKFFCACQQIQNVTVTFPKLISNIGITSIGSKSEQLFTNINSFDELKSEILKCGNIASYCYSRGFYAPVMVFNLANAIPDIAVADFIFHNSMRSVGLTEVTVSMTGSMSLHGKKLTKAEFVTKCNRLCTDTTGIQIYEIRVTSAVSSNPFVLYSVTSSSSKFITGKRRGKTIDEFGDHDVLMLAEDFYNLLERKMLKWEQTIQQSNKERNSLTRNSLSESLQVV